MTCLDSDVRFEQAAVFCKLFVSAFPSQCGQVGGAGLRWWLDTMKGRSSAVLEPVSTDYRIPFAAMFSLTWESIGRKDSDAKCVWTSEFPALDQLQACLVLPLL